MIDFETTFLTLCERIKSAKIRDAETLAKQKEAEREWKEANE